MKRWIGAHQFDIAVWTLILSFVFLLTQAVISMAWGGVKTGGLIAHPMSERIWMGLSLMAGLGTMYFVVWGFAKVLSILEDRQYEQRKEQ